MHPSTRRALETIERVNETLERTADRTHVDETWQPKEPECPVPEFPQSTPRTKEHSKPSLARDEIPNARYIEKRLEQFAQMIGAECGAANRSLRDQVGELRAEVSALRTLLTASQEAARLRSEIAELKSARRCNA